MSLEGGREGGEGRGGEGRGGEGREGGREGGRGWGREGRDDCYTYYSDGTIGSYREYAIAIDGEAGDSLT